MLNPGTMLSGRYEIIEMVGSGGMSEVYKAKCHVLNRFVAIKVLKPEFSSDVNFVTKFRIEAQSAAGLSHPNIVNVYDVGEDNGVYYIVMERKEALHGRRTDYDPLLGANRAGHFGNPDQIRPLPAKNRQQHSQ